MTISKNVESILTRSSFIRKMFEEGARLKAEHGADKVYDFSLGNPNLDPPEEFNKALVQAAGLSDKGYHGYMPNAGYPFVREAVAKTISKEQNEDVKSGDVIMTCGAAGGLNVILKTILDPGDEVVVPAPYFVEYGFYAENHGGILKTVQTKADFSLDLEAISSAITQKTKAVLINSPNNPTGQVYSMEHLTELGNLLKSKSEEMGKTIYLVSDEPYRKIVFDGITVPSIFNCCTESIITSSYSKDLSIPGERIGFIAVNPGAAFKEDLLNGMMLANRILGFVNAPALMQRVVGLLQGARVDASEYERKRNILCEGLEKAGYDFIKPPGTFYLFPKTPVDDDVAFVDALRDELVLAVPGSGFGAPGYFRIAFCVADETITNALPGFRKVMENFL
ncbi:MAG: pyridoxal phosphate-dependent aminotransferase [Deltaproteobacteria bacterium]|nr:pyridoxal phosphate-dependent aminotransferase [Deltaproteobacteria bacterium]